MFESSCLPLESWGKHFKMYYVLQVESWGTKWIWNFYFLFFLEKDFLCGLFDLNLCDINF